MNHIAEEILSYLEEADDESLQHYGIKRRSGRYPWGSGDDPYQHGMDFLGRIEELKKSGWTETTENIKKEFGLTSNQYRSAKACAKTERRALDVARAKSLKEDGLGESEIARRMSTPERTVNESTVRSWLNAKSEERMNAARNTADFIKQRVDEKGMIDIGAGVERELNISREKLKQATDILEAEGYHVLGGRVPQATNPGQYTTIKVIAPPDTPYKINSRGQKVSSAIYDFDQIHTMKDYTSHDGGETFDRFVYPKSMDSNRLKIRYAEEGGVEKDGIVEIRRGVPDLSLGDKRYAQVRILVDDKKYIKGMAVYSDDMPEGVDVIFNTNKSKDKPKLEVLKDIKSDPDNPFGSLIKAGGQSYYIDKDGNRQLGLINRTREEGDWSDWADALPSQFLSKQSKQMAKKQLGLAAADREAEFEEICSLTNPTVKKHLLRKFADECDSAAVHLKAAALPGQKHHVIIPITSMKDTEVYAPGYTDGTKLALIRYPHGGTFEIPILTVNNKHPVAKKLLGTDIMDAVGINSKVAEQLSGADFDGDTVMCIPTHDPMGKVRIASQRRLKGLIGFDPKAAYGPDTYEPGSVKLMKNTQTEMGKISNLITDMQLHGGATNDEVARAVRHSMVVIDAEKHKLNYKQSEIDNDIAGLIRNYQRHVDENGKVRYGGASTIISRASGQQSVVKRQGTPRVNMKGKEWYDPSRPEGAYIYREADDAHYQITKTDNRTGETKTITKTRMQRSTKMAETDDAYSLVSEARHPMELVYADHANRMKALANRARKEEMSTGKIEYSASAKTAYQEEVASLESKLNIALLNAPRERQAQLRTSARIAEKKADNPDMTNKELRKASQQALTKYRGEVGSVSRSERSIKITDREWEAIQAGAISESKLKKILNNTDIDALRERATPRSTTALSTAKTNRIKALSASNYTIAEIARKLGVSTTTVSQYLKGEN